jgi:hypothetical protein
MDKILKPGEHEILHGREYSKFICQKVKSKNKNKIKFRVFNFWNSQACIFLATIRQPET